MAAEVSVGGKWLCDSCAQIALPVRTRCENCHRLSEVRTCHNKRWLCGECYHAECGAECNSSWAPFACDICKVQPDRLYILGDGRKACWACYNVAQPWRVDDGTRANYESAINAIRGAGYEASAEMIESYVKELQGERQVDK
jgi:hypothetical protein